MNFGEHKGKVEDAFAYSTQRREGLAQLSAALRERVSIELEITKRFEKLAGTNFSAFNTPSLEELANSLRQMWVAQAIHSKNLADTLERELVQPLVYYHSIQNDQHRTTVQQARDLFKHAKNYIARVEKGKLRYSKACKDTEAVAASLLEAQNGSEDPKRRILGKVQAGRAEIVMSEDEYQSSVHDLNSFEIEYSSHLVTTTQTVYLSDLAKQELSRAERLKTDLSKMLAFEIGKAKRLISDRERIAKILEAFSPEAEVSAVNSHTSQQIPPLQPVDFVPYSGSHPMFQTETLRMTRLGEDWTDLLRYLTYTSQLNYDIEVLMSRAWHGDELVDSDFEAVRNRVVPRSDA